MNDPTPSRPALLLSFVATIGAGAALARLPEPSPDEKAKAAETAAKTAWSNQVAEYQLCQAMNRVAAGYLAQAKSAGKTVAPVATPPCTDPGAFRFTPQEPKPLEASGAHSPPQPAATPPGTTAPAASAIPR